MKIRHFLPAAWCFALSVFAADPSPFPFRVTDVSRNSEGLALLKWKSEAGAVYRVEYTEQLGTTWKPLLRDIPSQGADTLATDGGDYTTAPEIPKPITRDKRFYRVVRERFNVGVTPTISISTPAAGSTVSGVANITVTASHPNGISEIRLFVDGQEYDHTDSVPAVFALNTSEWANGSHSIHAIAFESTAAETTPSTGTPLPNIGASARVSFNFNNYVSSFFFSEDLFQPEIGETQKISAVFSQNSTWTLTITDSVGATVRTATGTGATMVFNWNGTNNVGGSPPIDSYEFALNALAVGAAAPAGGAAGSPRRAARKIKGSPGTVGIAYQGNHPDLPIASFTRPTSGFPAPLQFVTLDPVYQLPYGKLTRVRSVAEGFAGEMAKGGWKTGFSLGDDALHGTDFRKPAKGGTSKFNDVNIGLYVGHGIHGVSIDKVATATGAFQTYIPIYNAGATNYDWVRLSECDFGSANLRWMGIFACNILNETSYNDMYTKTVLPINNSLHLLLGSKTSVFMYPSFGQKWASAMLGREAGGTRSVSEAWFYSGTLTQPLASPTGPVILRVAGWSDCFSDTLKSYSPPNSGDPLDITYEDREVF